MRRSWKTYLWGCQGPWGGCWLFLHSWLYSKGQLDSILHMVGMEASCGTRMYRYVSKYSALIVLYCAKKAFSEILDNSDGTRRSSHFVISNCRRDLSESEGDFLFFYRGPVQPPSFNQRWFYRGGQFQGRLHLWLEGYLPLQSWLHTLGQVQQKSVVYELTFLFVQEIRPVCVMPMESGLEVSLNVSPSFVESLPLFQRLRWPLLMDPLHGKLSPSILVFPDTVS